MKAFVIAVLLLGVGALAQGPAVGAKPKVRAITAFVRLDRDHYQSEVADALVVLRRAKAEFVASGYEVETIRIVTQPLAELVAGMTEDDALKFLTALRGHCSGNLSAHQ